uniref:ATP-binding cassette sub-family F member 2-like n=1 Tax=Callorhinchus milii TaxID=7868 RepID=A0A4W3IRL0_CALMI|eukprot:gi/632985141/ref/XP_007909511.1/ PREDICTED: ATP-binding cassette sub-family F member 2-like [Callorhinchus milii]
MPSDMAKKKAAKRKEAAKSRGRKPKAVDENGDVGAEEVENSVTQTNGTATDAALAQITVDLNEFELKKAAARAVTGVLASHPNSTDVHIINLSLTFHGQELLSDTKLELNTGRRYGLLGLNGTGKCCSLSLAL